MRINFLKNAVEVLSGKSARDIVDLLFEKKDINEFLIAKKLNLTINQTRNILYKLGDSGLVSFTRKKDKRKGWYIYFWTLNELKCLELLENRLVTEISLLKNQLKNRKSNRFYFCESCKMEVKEETALLNDFMCHECGQVFTLANQDKAIKELEANISRLNNTLLEVRAEKLQITDKISKKFKRKDARERKIKEVERKKNLAKRKKEREKVKRAEEKKKPTKKKVMKKEPKENKVKKAEKIKRKAKKK